MSAHPQLLWVTSDVPVIRVLPKLALFLVWLTFALSFFVFKEPAPFDFLLVLLIFCLPLLGFTIRTITLTLYTSFWLVITAASLLAATQANIMSEASSHVIITLFLAVGSSILAGFVALHPNRHVSLIMNGYLCAGLIACLCALLGYFNLIPGAYDIFTKFGRASGTFKDPNVFGTFIIPPFIYVFHLWSRASFFKGLLYLLMMLLLAFGVFLSFSRGAWLHLVISTLAFCFLSFATAYNNIFRLRLIILAMCGIFISIGLLGLISQSESISSLLQQRASLSQSYDSGPEGRFGGQEKAVDLILEHPLGIGALEFSKFHHREDVHNIYLSMFLNAGWVGGLLYLFLVLFTLIYGFKICLQRTNFQSLFIVAYSCFAGLALEGAIIDTDHWRHFFILLALIWGMIAASAQNISISR